MSFLPRRLFTSPAGAPPKDSTYKTPAERGAQGGVPPSSLRGAPQASASFVNAWQAPLKPATWKKGQKTAFIVVVGAGALWAAYKAITADVEHDPVDVLGSP